MSRRNSESDLAAHPEEVDMIGKAVIFLVISISLFLAYLKDKPVTYADSQTIQVYEITLEGSVGDRPFKRQGALFVMPAQAGDDAQSAASQVNFWILSGKPAGTAGVGALWLATYDGFYSGKLNELFAQVTGLNNELHAQFGPENASLNANAFSISADRVENVNQLASGRVDIQLLLDGKIEGSVELAGYNPLSQIYTTYSATLSGSYTGSRTW
jgi:hypothetical protein